MQGRLGSTRLPGKGLFTFFGQTVWERMCDIALEIEGVEKVVFATGDKPENYLVEDMIRAKGVDFFAGSEENVLQRFAKVAENSTADYILRFTCDNYLIQPEVVEALIAAMYEHDADYGYIDPLSHFSGEVICRSLLLEHYKSGNYSDMAREHVTWDIRHQDDLKKVVLSDDLLGLDHHMKLTLDNLEDLIALKKIESSYADCRNIRCLGAVIDLQKNLF